MVGLLRIHGKCKMVGVVGAYLDRNDPMPNVAGLLSVEINLCNIIKLECALGDKVDIVLAWAEGVDIQMFLGTCLITKVGTDMQDMISATLESTGMFDWLINGGRHPKLLKGETNGLSSDGRGISREARNKENSETNP